MAQASTHMPAAPMLTSSLPSVRPRRASASARAPAVAVPVGPRTRVIRPIVKPTLGMLQPSTKVRGLGISLMSPMGAPASTQETIWCTSSELRRRSLAKWPYRGSANQGGILPVATCSLITFAQGRVSVYVRSGIGPISPGRWQVWQFFWRMGTMSRLNVGAAKAALPSQSPVNSQRVPISAKSGLHRGGRLRDVETDGPIVGASALEGP